jgi:hypothetical protein
LPERSRHRVLEGKPGSGAEFGRLRAASLTYGLSRQSSGKVRGQVPRRPRAIAALDAEHEVGVMVRVPVAAAKFA